jgi:hypothetical protein
MCQLKKQDWRGFRPVRRKDAKTQISLWGCINEPPPLPVGIAMELARTFASYRLTPSDFAVSWNGCDTYEDLRKTDALP